MLVTQNYIESIAKMKHLICISLCALGRSKIFRKAVCYVINYRYKTRKTNRTPIHHIGKHRLAASFEHYYHIIKIRQQSHFTCGSKKISMRMLVLVLNTAYLIFFSLFCFFSDIAADERTLTPKDPPADKLDVVLVVDASASMRITDPKRLRDQGTILFLQFLREGDSVGIVQFDKEAKVLAPLTPFNSNQASVLSTLLGNIPNDGLYTDINAGIASAATLLKQQRRPDSVAALVVISDGKMDPIPEKGSGVELSRKTLEEVAPELKDSGISVYTLAFSEQADREFLSQLAIQSGGLSWYANTSETLHSSFADLLLAVKKPQVIPLKKKGFSIDGNVNEATFYLDSSKENPIVLVSPTGERLTESRKPNVVKWFTGEQFTVITIPTPFPGIWTVEGVDEREAFATLLTQLKLVVDWPANVLKDEPAILQAQLFDGVKPIAIPQIAGVAKFGFQVIRTDVVSPPIATDFLNDNGEDGDEIANDGIFSFKLSFSEAGEYKIRVLAQAPTFEREQARPFRVRPEWLTIRTSAESGAPLESEKGGDKEETQVFQADEASRIIVEASPDLGNLKNVDISLYATDIAKNGEKHPIPIKEERERVYEAHATDLPGQGIYDLSAEAINKLNRGRLKNFQSKKIRLKYLPHDEQEPIVEHVIIPEKKKSVKLKNSVEVSQFPVVPVCLMSLLNVGVGFASILLQKKRAEKTSNPDLVSLDTIPEDIQHKSELLRAIVNNSSQFSESFNSENSSDIDSEREESKDSKDSNENITKSDEFE